MEDSSLMPPADKIDSMTPGEIREYSETAVRDRMETARRFNKEFGAKTKYRNENLSGIGPIDLPYDTDEYSRVRMKALGFKPNAQYDPNRDKSRGPNIKVKDVTGKGKTIPWLKMAYQNTIRPVGDALFGGSEADRNRELNAAHPADVMYAQQDIINAAVKTGQPVWKDKELMADPDFRKRVEENEFLNSKYKAYEAKRREEASNKEKSETALANLNLKALV